MNALDSFVSRKYKGCETVGRAIKKTHMAMMETKAERINILNEEKMNLFEEFQFKLIKNKIYRQAS